MALHRVKSALGYVRHLSSPATVSYDAVVFLTRPFPSSLLDTVTAATARPMSFDRACAAGHNIRRRAAAWSGVGRCAYGLADGRVGAATGSGPGRRRNYPRHRHRRSAAADKSLCRLHRYVPTLAESSRVCDCVGGWLRCVQHDR